MDWYLSFAAAMIVLITAIVYAIAAAGKYRAGRIATPLNVVFGGLFVSVFICLLPIYHSILADAAGGVLKTIAFSLHNTFQVFTVDADRSLILESIACREPWLSATYSGFLSVAFVAAPILTFGFVLSLLWKRRVRC